MPPSKVWTAKPDAPPYVTVTTADIWNTVKNKWESLGSPAAQCPSPQFGEVGSARNEACRSRVAPIWDKFENVFPDLPTIGPYNNLQDLVKVEEVCALGHFDDPEADIGPVPNLFENPTALPMKLQEWYLRSLVPLYCEIAPTTSMDGACFCWPYYWEFTYRTRSQGAVDWSAVGESRGVFFGPLRGFGVKMFDGPNFEDKGYQIYARGAENPGGFRYGTINDCTIASQDYQAAAGSGGFVDAEIVSVNRVYPFTPEEVAYAGLGYGDGPNIDGTCPVPNNAPPLPNYPNTRGFYVPLPVPIISFPVAPGCPLQEDNLNITFNISQDPPPKGDKGDPGDPGKDGPTMLKTIEKIASEYTQWIANGNTGNKGGVYGLRSGTAFVSIVFNIDGVTQDNYREKRVYFSPVNDDYHRKEVGLGNVYLRLSGSNDSTKPRMEISMSRMLIEVPPSPQYQNWELVINDKADAGFSIVDLGYRHVVRKLGNPDDVPSFDYYDPN